MTPLNLIHIVRRYGPVGGMERYVWELTLELSKLGHHVTILCQKCYSADCPKNMRIIELGEILQRPRWLSHFRFSGHVSHWLKNHDVPPGTIIHSHERSGVHHVSTFHGPPFASVLDKPWWKRISLRVAANLWLEGRELNGPTVQAVIPNSEYIAKTLLHYYPNISSHITTPITPGVGNVMFRPNRALPEYGGVIGFIGKEWKRKGLDIAVGIIREIQKRRPETRFRIAGPSPSEVQHLFGQLKHVTLLGEVDNQSFYTDLDLLLHPARHEPYGMVVAEAAAAAVPVVISDQCGAKDHIQTAHVLSLDQPLEVWAEQCVQAINSTVEPISRSWREVALDHIPIYTAIH